MDSGAASGLGNGTRSDDVTTVWGVVRDVVAQVAPEELPVVAGLSGFDDQTVRRRLAKRAKRAEPLGFGLGEAVVLVTPIVWTAIQEVIKRMADSAADTLAGRFKAAARRVLRRKPPSPPVPRFSTLELAEVRRRILEEAERSGLAQKRATLIADSVVGRLALIGTTVGADAPPIAETGSTGGGQ
jgi:hypothetical protein